MHISTKYVIVATLAIVLLCVGSTLGAAQSGNNSSTPTATAAGATGPDTNRDRVPDGSDSTESPMVDNASTPGSPDGPTPRPTTTARPESSDSERGTSDELDEGPAGSFVDRLSEDECAAPRPLGNNTVLCSASLVDDGATAELVLRTDSYRRVTFVDVGGFFTESPVRPYSVTLQPGEPNTVSVSVTRGPRGYVGVSATVDGVIYPIPIESDNALIGGPWTVADAQIAALSGATSAVVVTVFVVMRYIAARDTESERIA